jgi:hypothetical protein
VLFAGMAARVPMMHAAIVSHRVGAVALLDSRRQSGHSRIGRSDQTLRRDSEMGSALFFHKERFHNLFTLRV